jgi:hypothetical protein
LDGTTTQLRVTHLPNPFSYEYLCKGYNVTVQVYLGSHQGGGINSLTKTIFVEDCWSVMGNRSLEVCGVQVPSPPVNISAVLSVNSSSNESTLRVTWDPPLHHNTPIEKYWIEFLSSNGSSVKEDLISPNETKYTLSERDLAVLSKIADVRVSGGTVIKWVCQTCCRSQVVSGSSFSHTYTFKRSPAALISVVSLMQTATSSLGFPPSIFPVTQASSFSTIPSTTHTRTSISSGSDISKWLIVGSSVIVCLMLLTASVVCIAIVAFAVSYKRKSTCGARYVLDEECSSSNEDRSLCEPRPVFLVASTEEDEEMGKKMRYLVHDLADHGIEAVYYEYERTSHDPHSPAALGIARWVERQFQRCDLVLFACTQNFLKEWRRESVDVLNPVVWSSRHVLDGILPHQDNMSRFGVVLMGEDCIIPEALRRFQTFRLFDTDKETIHSDQLMEYVFQRSLYQVPRIRRIFLRSQIQFPQ